MRLTTALSAIVLAATLAPPHAAGQGSPGWAIANAEAAADAVEALREDPAYAPFFLDPGVGKRLQQAHAKLALAKDSLADVHNRYAGNQAYEFGLAAERDFRALERELRQRWERQQTAAFGAGGETDEAERERLLAEIRALVIQGREILARPASSWPTELATRAELGRTLAAAAGADAGMPAEALRRLRDDLAEAGTAARYAYRTWPSLGPLKVTIGWVEPPRRRSVPSLLRRAVERFLGGDYADTTEILRDFDIDDGAARALAHLIRGAAAYSLWVESGEREGTLLERALADARACRGSDPRVAPAGDAFSPRYVALFSRS